MDTDTSNASLKFKAYTYHVALYYIVLSVLLSPVLNKDTARNFLTETFMLSV